MKIFKPLSLLAVATLLAAFPPRLNAKPFISKSLKSQVLSELLQRLIEEQEEVLAQEEANQIDNSDREQNMADTKDTVKTMSNELEVAETEGSSRGVTYTRYGHNKCPRHRNTYLLYEGLVAGTYYNHKGGSANYLCLPDEPEYGDLKTSGSSHFSRLYGTEYELPIKGKHNHGAPCAVCYDTTDNTQLMIPATTRCPRGWSRDYYGYLMGPGNYGDRHPKDYICVDKEQKSSRGSHGNQNGALLYHVKIACHGIHCPPYKPNDVLTCVVCSR